MTSFFEKSYKNTRTKIIPDFGKKSGIFRTFRLVRDGSPEGPAGVPVCHFVEFLQILPVPQGLHKSGNHPNSGMFVKHKQK